MNGDVMPKIQARAYLKEEKDDNGVLIRNVTRFTYTISIPQEIMEISGWEKGANLNWDFDKETKIASLKKGY